MEKKLFDTASTQDEQLPLVQLVNITKQYKHKLALKNINLTINKGDRIGVIGANGSGKSTMSEIIAGIRKPTSGEIKKDDNLKIGIQFQESRYPEGVSVMDMLKYYLETFQVKMNFQELDDLLETYQLTGLENKLINRLSGGQQQRLNILLSVILDPDLVILDEVSTGLDIEVRSEIFAFLRRNIVEKNKTMLLVTHMMSEIEEFCHKYIYIHDGEILDSGYVSDIVKEYGSVHNYTVKMFDTYKKKSMQQLKDLRQQIESNNKKYAPDKLFADGQPRGKNKPLINLILKYYYRGFFVPFFLVAYPILILFLMGLAYSEGPNALTNLQYFVCSNAVLQAVTVGIWVIPQTIIEFKNSVLMKRIGATNIKPFWFVISVVSIGLVFIVISFFWTLLWAGILYGYKYGWSEVALPKNVWPVILFGILAFASSLAFGMMLASLFKSTTAFIAIGNVIYLPISILSGGLVPMNMILSNDILKVVTYFNPFKYTVNPLLDAWVKDNFHLTAEYGAYIGVAFVLMGFYTAIASWKLRWQS